MRKYVGRFVVFLAFAALVAVPGVALGYSIPKPSGGTKSTTKPTTKVGKAIESSSCAKDLNGIKVRIHEKAAGKLTATLTHSGSKIGGGSVKYSKPSTKTLLITFNSAGKTLLKSDQCSGAPVTLKMTFKPKHGSSSTSTVHLKLG